jgi:hypothetical protein
MRTALVFCAFLVGVTPAMAAPLGAGEARAVVAEVTRLVQAHYVIPERRAAIVAAVNAALATGRYDVADRGEFASRITEDLRAAGQDRHLFVADDPAGFEDLRHAVGAGAATSPSPRRQAIGRRRHQGFEEMRILDGNVRYVRISGFLWSDDTTGLIVDEVARFLDEGDAVVIDLRGNGGGDASPVERLISYFMPPDNRVLMTFHDGLTGETSINRVANDLAGPRMVGRPLYVLIDPGTASAAEEFAYHVQQFKLGLLVGANTAGAGNNNELFPAAAGFVASVSVGRPEHPVSRSNWEGTGIAPDVAVAPETALEQAHLLALRGLAKNAGDDDRRAIEWTATGLEARLHPPTVAARDLKAYAGHYGVRTVWLDKETLAYQREGRPATTLIPMGPDLFAFPDTGDVRVRFRRNGGKVVGFDQITVDGQVIPSERTD